MTPTTASSVSRADAALPPPIAPECPDSGIPAGSRPIPGLDHHPVLPSLSVVLPCRDAAASIADAIRNAASAAAAASHDYEVIVVDDASSDHTVSIAGRFLAADRRVRLLVHAQRRGQPDALRGGIREARGEWVLLAGADLQFDLREIEALLPLTRSADVLCGWPVLRRGTIVQRARSAAWNRLLRRALRLPVHDVNCPFKLIRRELLERCELRSGAALINAELLVQCRAQDARFHNVGVHHRAALPRADATVTGTGLGALWSLARAYPRLRALSREPVR